MDNHRIRIKEYDIAKGIGILLVIIGHNVDSTKAAHMFIYSFHMPLFFVLSGLVVNVRCKASLKNERVLVASYFFYSSVYILYDLIVRVRILKHMNTRQLIWEVYQTMSFFGISVLWFISTLIGAKLIAKWIYEKCEGKQKCILIAIFIYLFPSWIANAISTTQLVGIIYYPLISVIRTIGMSSFVLLGIVFSDEVKASLCRIERKVGYKSYYIIALCGLTVLLLYKFTDPTDIHYMKVHNSIVVFITSISGTILVLEISKLLKRFTKLSSALEYMGRHSLFIMVTSEYLMIQDVISGMCDILSVPLYAKTVIVVLILCLVEILITMCFEQICNQIIRKLAGCNISK